MRIETMLQEGIEDGFSELKKVQVGTESYKTTVDGLTKLVDRAIELEKLEADIQNKVDDREAETELRLKQVKEEKRDRFVKIGLTAASVFGGIGLTVWGALKSWKFEEVGTVTSGPGREFMKKLFHMR